MLILLGYLAGMVLLTVLLRKRSVRVRSFLLMGFTYLFIIPLYFFARLTPETTPAGCLTLLLRCAYDAPKAMAFGADLSRFDDPALTLLFYLMSLYTVRTVLVVFFHRAFSALVNRLRTCFRREIYVVCGKVPGARAMIAEIRKKEPRAAVIFVPQKEADESADLRAVAETRPWEKFLRPGKRYRILLLPDGKNNNLHRLDELDRVGERLPELHVTAYLDNDLLRFEDLCYPHLDAYLVSREQQLIRSFLLDHRPLKALQARASGAFREDVWEPARPFSLCILGFGALSREFLLSTWENASFATAAPDGRGLDVLIADRDLDRRKAAFALDVPQILREPAFTWLSAAPDSEACIRAVLGRLATLDQVLIATEDTRFNLELAMRLVRLFRRHGLETDQPQLVVALLEQAEGSVEFLSRESGGVFLQSNASQFTFAELVERATDRRAEETHRQYRQQSLFAPEWSRLGTYLQNANRAVVWDVPNKLLLSPNAAKLPPDRQEAAFWRLAQYEHLRWNTFQYTHGWTLLPREELTPAEVTGCITKREAQKRYACLVPWDELDTLPQARPGLLKSYDYANVTALFAPEDPPADR